MIDREPVERVEGLDEAAIAEGARARFDLESLIETGRPHVEAYIARTPGAPRLEDVPREGAEVTMMMAGVFADADAWNSYQDWVRPVREAARRRFGNKSLNEQRDYAIGIHLKGAQDHPELLTDISAILDAVTEECYDEDYGWPSLILHKSLKG